LAICVLLIFWYRVPGLIASINLLLYGIVMLFIIQRLPVVLTSAGIAGFIISLGMAVDANILLSERLKEELHEGKNLREAIASAWTRAWTSIRDGNLSSIITAILLYIIGTMLIKGFAVTFGLGVVVSLLVAVLVSRVLLVAISPVKLGRVGQFFFSSGFHTK
jgi:protein-export membrane protein SecD